jgi:hypothetical protein
VILRNELNVYIAGYNDTSKKYKGFDVNNGKNEIEFSEEDVILTV